MMCEGYSSYEVLSFTPLPEIEMERAQARWKDHAMTALFVYGKDMTEKERETLWEVMTSRGADRLIYGPMPKE